MTSPRCYAPFRHLSNRIIIGLPILLLASSVSSSAVGFDEIDQFARAGVAVWLQDPSGATQLLLMTGPATSHTFFEGSAGQAVDDDANGLDDVATELSRLDVSASRPDGLVQLRLSPTLPTTGQMEESANQATGTFDVPPFSALGSANAHFDIFFEIELPSGTVLHNQVAPRISGQLSHLPPAEQESYSFAQQLIPLVDALGQPTNYSVVQLVFFPVVTSGFTEIDNLASSTLLLELSDGLPDSSPTTLALVGPSETHVFFETAAGQALDDDGNGLDEVTTELVSLSLIGGGATLDLSPVLRSPGRLEELSNSTIGTLDLLPYGLGGADSIFDLFFVLHLADGRVLHNTRALRVRADISHSPPHTRHIDSLAPGESLDLVDAAGLPSGLSVTKATYHPGQVEIDDSPRVDASVEILAPGNVSEVVSMSGPSTVHVFFERPEGAAVDDDGNGLDEVEAEISRLELAGSGQGGLLRVRLAPGLRADGMMEERVDATPSVLDVLPFAPTGFVDSFFDVFLEIELSDGTRLHTQDPKRLTVLLARKPPGSTTSYENSLQTPLYDSLGMPSGYSIGAIRLTPQPAPGFVETDHFAETSLLLKVASGAPDAPPQRIVLRGSSTSQVFFEGPLEGDAVDDDGDLLDEVQTELTGLSVRDSVSTVQLDVSRRSPGLLEEQIDVATGTMDVPPFGMGHADSVFDLFLEMSPPSGVTLHNPLALRVQADTLRKPAVQPFFHPLPAAGPIELYDTQGVATQIYIVGATLHPGYVEVDELSNVSVEIHLTPPGGSDEHIASTGAATLYTYFEGAEGAADDDDGNGRDEVEAELGELDLTGSSSSGLVHVRLRPATHSMGRIEEAGNATPAWLDVPPFAVPGSADSSFGVFFEIELPSGAKLHNADPLQISSVITSQPPAPSDLYSGSGGQELLDEGSLPSGYFIGPVRLVPEPGRTWLLATGLVTLAGLVRHRRRCERQDLPPTGGQQRAPRAGRSGN